MRNIFALVVFFLVACDTDEGELDGGRLSDGEVADVTELDAELEPDAELLQLPSCGEINESGEDCRLVLLEQPGGFSCLIPVYDDRETSGACYVDDCAYAFGTDSVLQPGSSCKIITNAATTQDGTQIACACLSAEVTSSGGTSEITDSSTCAPYSCLD